MSKRAVEEYYDKCQKLYSLFWYDEESLGMHYGFWDSSTNSRREALINEYKELNKLLQPKKDELILDAGCGVGGASIWLAKETNTNLVGITLSSKQVELAKNYSLKNEVSDYNHFFKMDFFNTGFKEETFDKVFAIESFCHSYPNQIDFLREMYRILKKGGRILLFDGLLLRNPENGEERETLKEFCRGWKLNSMSTVDEIVGAFKKSGFKEVRFTNKTESILKSANQIHRLGVIGYPILKILRFFRLISKVELEHVLGMLSQKKLFVRTGMGVYGIFQAEK